MAHPMFVQRATQALEPIRRRDGVTGRQLIAHPEWVRLGAALFRRSLRGLCKGCIACGTDHLCGGSLALAGPTSNASTCMKQVTHQGPAQIYAASEIRAVHHSL